MPIYSLQCTNCKAKEEVICKVDERNSQLCRQCGSPMELLPTTCGVKWNCDSGTATHGRECD